VFSRRLEGCDPTRLFAHEPPGSLEAGDAGDDAAPSSAARRHGQRPSISTSSEKLRNVLMSTIIVGRAITGLSAFV
jgi:hypothetical protein